MSRLSGALLRVLKGARSITSSGARFSGAIAYSLGAITKAYAGVLRFSGSAKRVLTGFRTYTGSFRLSGIVSGLKGLAKTYAGSFRLSGALSYIRPLSARTIAGLLRFTGAVARVMTGSRTYAGAVRFAGAISYAVGTLKQVGALRFSKVLLYIRPFSARTLAGSMTFSGVLSRGGYSVYNAASAMCLAGTVSHILSLNRTISGNLNPIGQTLDVSIDELYYGVQNP